MTQPREILPGRFYLVSRRCTQRQFLLRPDATTNGAFRYCIIEACNRFGVCALTWLAMSNHYHAVLYDPGGVLPEFLGHFHRNVAKTLNVHRNREENFWASEQASVVQLIDEADVIDKIIYVLSNPVADHLVDRAFDWPGETTLPYLDGREIVAERPRVFFSTTGRMPAKVSLRLGVPAAWEGSCRAAWAERIRSGVAQREQKAREERLARGTRIVGRRAVRKMSPQTRPCSHEPLRRLSPRIACRDPERRSGAIEAGRRFRADHAAARRELAAGRTNVVFPAGTYKMRRLGHRCAPFPPPLHARPPVRYGPPALAGPFEPPPPPA